MAKPKNFKQQQGQLAEAAACQLLEQNGLSIITRNYRCKFGEIDIIASEQNSLVFVEVRYRKHVHHGSSIESITPQKLHKITQTANHYLLNQQLYDKMMVRIDVIGFDENIEHPQWLKNITL